jgi:hypothetical protein
MRLALLVLVLAPALAVAGDASIAKQRRQELNALQNELFRKTLLVRADVRETGPVPGQGRLTELLDGSYYEHADAGIAYEALSPVVIERMSLRKDGHLLLATLVPPSNILPPSMSSDLDPEVGVPVFVEVDVDAAGGVRQAVATLVYLPGESPDEAAVATCLARYPRHDEKQSRLRCGLPAQ